jgi:RNA recognition motif-containing protein
MNSYRSVGIGPDGANIFVGNFPPDTTEDGLRTLFAPFGNVVGTCVYLDKVTKVSKQFGLFHWSGCFTLIFTFCVW